MIQANVAAAETLEETRAPLLYRVHDAPSDEKLDTLREFLLSLDMKLAEGQRSSRGSSTASCCAPRPPSFPIWSTR